MGRPTDNPPRLLQAWIAEEAEDTVDVQVAVSVTYLDQAIHAARQGREPCIESYAVLRKSFVALYGEKDPRKGLALAAEAAAVARSCSPSLTGLAMLHVAEGHAMNGERHLCEAALSEAEAEIGENSAA